MCDVCDVCGSGLSVAGKGASPNSRHRPFGRKWKRSDRRRSSTTHVSRRICALDRRRPSAVAVDGAIIMPLHPPRLSTMRTWGIFSARTNILRFLDRRARAAPSLTKPLLSLDDLLCGAADRVVGLPDRDGARRYLRASALPARPYATAFQESGINTCLMRVRTSTASQPLRL